MEQTAELAGLFTAHAVWCVSDGSTLIPMVAFHKADGTREMHRMVTDQLEDGVARGRQWIMENREAPYGAVLIYDGFVTLDVGKIDALLVEAEWGGVQAQTFVMAVPYRHATNPAGFAVHRPKFISFVGFDPDLAELGEAFFRGVDQHEKGAEVWAAHLDQSI
jgi:hypothetical protein